MILGSETPLKVGSRHVCPVLTDREGRPHYGRPIFVLREATFEEWQSYLRSEGVPEERVQLCVGPAQIICAYFYEVSID